jgi:hypothetical protein
MTDYAELNLYLEEDQTVDLWIHLDDDKLIVVKDVQSNPTRYHGWWHISHKFVNRPAVAMVESSKILYFVTIGDREVSDEGA